MPYTITAYPEGLPALIISLHQDFNLKEETEKVINGLTTELDAAESPIYYINEIANFPLNFSGLLSAMATSAAGKTSILRHPNIKEVLIITQSNLINFGVSALSQAQYGGITVRKIDSIEAALDYIRKQISDQRSRE